MKKHLATFGILLRQALVYQLVPAVIFFIVILFEGLFFPESQINDVVSSFFFDIFALGTIVIWYRMYSHRVAQELFRAQISFRRLVALIPLSLLTRLPLLVILVVLSIILGEAFTNTIDAGVDFQWSIFGEAVGWERILVFISFVLIGPIHEELFFRGLVLRTLRDRYSVKSAVVVSTIIFTLFHFHPGLFISSFVLGLFLAWVYVKWDNLLYSIILHILINSHPFILEYLSQHIQ